MMMSSDEFSQSLEVGNEFFVVVLALYVEFVPDVSAEDHASETFVVRPSDGVGVHSSESVNVLVYESVSCRFVYFNSSERCFFLWQV